MSEQADTSFACARRHEERREIAVLTNEPKEQCPTCGLWIRVPAPWGTVWMVPLTVAELKERFG